MKALVLIAALLPAGLASADEVYKYTDDNGVVHYTDKPVPGAVKAKLPELQTFGSGGAAGSPAPPAASAGPPVLPPEAAAIGFYSSISVVQPGNDEVFHTADAIKALAAVQPSLQTDQGHQLVFYLDGKQLPAPPGDSGVSLKDIGRGTHTLSAGVVDSLGKVLIQSSDISFHYLPPTVAGPASKRQPENTR